MQSVAASNSALHAATATTAPAVPLGTAHWALGSGV
jgi:hypothetical protein